MAWLKRMEAYGHLAWSLRGYLGAPPLSLEQCRSVVQQGLREREANLLRSVERAVFRNPTSPYRSLFAWAGCEYGDFAQMIRSAGIEATLHKLRAEGVYLSHEEFKGRCSVVRGSRELRFRASDLDNPLLGSELEIRTSGTRGSGTQVKTNLERYRIFAAHTRVAYTAHERWGSPVVLWLPPFPSAAWLVTMLRWARVGSRPVRWLSQLPSGSARPPWSQRLATRYLVGASRLLGAALPAPEHIELDRAADVAAIVAGIAKLGDGCILETYPSSAVRVCQAAQANGLDLSGATFAVCGEPWTDAKAAEVSRSGAAAVPMYAATEIGLLGFGCAYPATSDDVHLALDSQAVIQHRREVPHSGAEVDAFLFTSLLPTSAKVLLNVESGDYGAVDTRPCGCGLEALGLATHVSGIRGFDKLTGEGMTFVGTDFVRLIEEVLPSRFGGTSVDYQILEEEDERSRSRLTILASARLGAIDEAALVEIVLGELRRGRSGNRLMAQMWAQAETLRVRRATPLTTAAGKLLPLHIAPRVATRGATPKEREPSVR